MNRHIEPFPRNDRQAAAQPAPAVPSAPRRTVSRDMWRTLHRPGRRRSNPSRGGSDSQANPGTSLESRWRIVERRRRLAMIDIVLLFLCVILGMVLIGSKTPDEAASALKGGSGNF